MHTRCPQCQGIVVQNANRDGPNFCAQCCRLFYLPEEPKFPAWILGVLVVLMGNLQILSQ